MFQQGMTNNVRFTFSVGGTTRAVYRRPNTNRSESICRKLLLTVQEATCRSFFCMLRKTKQVVRMSTTQWNKIIRAVPESANRASIEDMNTRKWPLRVVCKWSWKESMVVALVHFPQLVMHSDKQEPKTAYPTLDILLPL